MYNKPGTLRSARNTIRDVQAVCSVLATRDTHIRPGPVITGAHATLDVDVEGVLVYRARDVLQHKVGDGHTVGRLSVVAVVRLRNDDAVISVAQRAVDGDVAVGDVGNAAGGVGNGFLQWSCVNS